METAPDDTGQLRDTGKIEEARALLLPTPVEVGVRPSWCSEQLLEGLRGLLDHFGRTTLADGREALVCEPYGINGRTLATAEGVAERHGLECVVSANSWHFPGWTIRLIFAKPPPRPPPHPTRRADVPHQFQLASALDVEPICAVCRLRRDDPLHSA